MNFIKRPCIDLYPGIRVTKDTVLDYKSDHVEQHIEKLVFRNISKVSGEGFSSVCDTTIQLSEGDILIFEDGGRGYIKPVEPFSEVQEAIADLEVVKEFGG